MTTLFSRIVPLLAADALSDGLGTYLTPENGTANRVERSAGAGRESGIRAFSPRRLT